MDNRIYPIGIQSFEKIRKGGYAYVDKTALAHQLVKSGNYFFLSRPRRFGKSLFLSTLEAYFQGKRELFEGLTLAQLEKEWVKRPVLHLDFGIGKYDTPESLMQLLNSYLTPWEALYGADSTEMTPALRFAGIVRRASEQTGHRVAILIDEFDKPLLKAIGNEVLQTEYLRILQPFCEVLKSLDNCIKFALLAGVTKIANASMEECLNNLSDLSMDAKFTTLCGFTEEELHRNFKDSLLLLAEDQGITADETFRKLTQEYGGYHFVEDAEGIFCPFSILNVFSKMKFGPYWFGTDSPAYLVELLKRNCYDLECMAHEQIDAESLNSVGINLSPIPYIYQSGFLTLKSYDKALDLYHLGFPNHEVEEGFIKFLMPYYVKFNKVEAPAELQRLAREFERGQPAASLKRLQSFFANILQDSPATEQLHYRNLLFIIFKLVGYYMQVQYHTSDGYVNLVLQTTDCVYLIVFKLEGTAEEALQLIEEKQYAHPFATDARRLLKIGVSFNSKTHNLGRWVVVE